MADKGWRKFDEIVGEDGTRCLIRVNHTTGEFWATVEAPKEEGTYFQRAIFSERGKVLEDLKKQATEFLKDNSNLEFKPVILIIEPRELNSWERISSGVKFEQEIELRYERYYLATRKDGSKLWKEFSVKRDGMEAIEGEAGRSLDRQCHSYGSLIDYTPEKWSALRLISHGIRALNEKLRSGLVGKEVNNFLETIAAKGAANLLPAPKVKA